MSDIPTQQPDEEQPATPDPGVDDGTVLETKEGSSVVKEKVVYDTDDDGNVVGWHKEAAK